MNLSIKQLRAFLVLSENITFTQAAQRFNLSQPAFSALIANLEEEIGYRLFDRDTRKVELNANGIHFIEIARRLILNYDEAINEITAHAAGRNGSLTLSVLPSLAVEWLPEILATYSKTHPQTQIKLNDTQWNQCLSSLVNGQADLALAASQPTTNIFDSTYLFSDKFYLLCHADHLLANRDKVSLEEVYQYPFIGFSPRTSIRQYTDKLFENKGIQLNYRLEVQQLTTMMGLISANYGISITTGLTLFQFKHKNIAIIPFEDIDIERDIYLIQLKNHTQPNHIKTFSDFIINQSEIFSKNT
ncbi:HTH-type transcriptional regulator GltC [Marinomonas spartinae]|uniref:HTH-type transcriptional regulator GltC n=1 Tax=Marinomonas spartinae TaxID=1792290 RepID=A0A1A8TFG6_9GAMM|nr:LysR family transcriptional regulator [Marinomonas spartinae]SBS31793.1 HTH-type transcriptional regulator GltC [Marinomonas spartinae]SBS34039.1 HTH-type transcriptional regulator GltC [Marinomonas spartinae]